MPAAEGDISDDLELYRRCELSPAREAVMVLVNAYRIFGADKLWVSFNGGKDACVVLHLARAALALERKRTGQQPKVRCVFFEQPDEFDEVKRLVEDVAVLPDVELLKLAGFQAGIDTLVQQANGGPVAFVLGTRSGDPHALLLREWEPSSPDYPPCVRVNPILHWTYGDVWSFLRGADVPYCCLYDQGFTSLGKKSETRPNPRLLKPDGSYGAASELTSGDWGSERQARDAPAQAEAWAEAAFVVVSGDPAMVPHVGPTAQLLKKRGVEVVRVCTARPQDAAEEIERLRQRTRLVFVWGRDLESVDHTFGEWSQQGNCFATRALPGLHPPFPAERADLERASAECQ